MNFSEALNQVNLGKRMQLPSWGSNYIQKQLDMTYLFSFDEINGKTYDQKKFYQPFYLDLMATDWQEAK
jgi:hypothetical protein